MKGFNRGTVAVSYLETARIAVPASSAIDIAARVPSTGIGANSSLVLRPLVIPISNLSGPESR